MKSSIDLIYLSQFEASIREALIILENKIQKLSGLYNLNGSKLIGEAFKLETDKNGIVTLFPKIKINTLGDVTELNEHEGVKLMLMGFFKSIRNIYMHKSINAEIFYTLNIITQVSFFIRVITDASLSQKITER